MVNIKDVMALNDPASIDLGCSSTPERRDLYKLLTDPDFDQYWNNPDSTKNIVTLERIRHVVAARMLNSMNFNTLLVRFYELHTKYDLLKTDVTAFNFTDDPDVLKDVLKKLQKHVTKASGKKP